MPDFKLWTEERARRYLAKRDYPKVARPSVREMHRQVGDLVLDDRGMARRGLIVRHLVMPGMVDETEAILRFVAEELGPPGGPGGCVRVAPGKARHRCARMVRSDWPRWRARRGSATSACSRRSPLCREPGSCHEVRRPRLPR